MFSKRLLFEEIVPRTAHLLGLPAYSTYEDIAIGLLERVADSLGIDRFRFYTIEELYGMLLDKRMIRNDEFIRESSKYLKSRDLLNGSSMEK
jgi:hypothetical protein